jgi:hypothetical protein
MKRGHRLIDRRRRTTIPFCRQHHDAACRFPRQTYRLGKYEQRFRLRVAHILFDTAVGTFDMSESGIADWLRRGGRVDLARNFTDDRVDF